MNNFIIMSTFVKLRSCLHPFLLKCAWSLADDLGIETAFATDGDPRAVDYVAFLVYTCKLPCELGEDELQKLNDCRRT